ncbi:MAG: outer membrane lipoprotein carrier protein LolA [Ignavibacteriaceae bacterium]|nr:outer membrane lipoprotein carrier protein LolA [Ignavibacteriaceae bacterium]
MKKINLVIIVLFLFPLITAQDDGAVLLKSLQDKFSGLKDLTVDFKQKSGERSGYSGKFFFKKENKMRFELKNITIITDGSTTWNYNKKEKKVIISNYNPEDASFISMKRLVFDYPSMCKVESSVIDGEKTLLLVPLTDELNFNYVRIWINKDQLISKTIIDDKSTGKIEVSFLNYLVDQNLPDKKFNFTPPKESKIIDLR